MKKSLILFSGLLILLFISLSFLDSSDYVVEKRLWKIQKEFKELIRDPKIVPTQKYDEVNKKYLQVIKTFSNSRLVPQIYFQVGRVYLLKKEFAKSRESYQEVLNRYHENKSLSAEALFNIGKVYEEEGDKTKAIQVYRDIINQYSTTVIGLNAPIYLANYYLRIKDSAGSQVALREAVAFYKKVAAENPGKDFGLDALRLLSVTYLAQGNWGDSVQALREILLKSASTRYLTSSRSNLIIKSINTVSVSQLKDYDLPINIYQEFVDQNPSHPLTRYLVKVISALKKFKADSKTIKKNE